MRRKRLGKATDGWVRVDSTSACYGAIRSDRWLFVSASPSAMFLLRALGRLGGAPKADSLDSIREIAFRPASSLALVSSAP